MPKTDSFEGEGLNEWNKLEGLLKYDPNNMQHLLPRRYSRGTNIYKTKHIQFYQTTNANYFPSIMPQSHFFSFSNSDGVMPTTNGDANGNAMRMWIDYLYSRHDPSFVPDDPVVQTVVNE